MNKKTISIQIDEWIAEEELPQSPFLKPINQFDDLYPEDEVERQAYFDFIEWAMNIEHELINSLPTDKAFGKRRFVQLDENGIDVSPNNTVDYQRQQRSFNKYHYRLKKIFEKLKDLAETYSCISNRQGKNNIRDKFTTIVDMEFLEKGRLLHHTLINHRVWCNKEKMMDRIHSINKNIRICNKIWNTYAFTP